MRVFVAVDISDEAKKEIEKLSKVFQKKHWPVKWEKPKKLHQTLVFLGSIKEDKFKLVKLACLRAVKNTSCFEISFKGLGCFPNYDYPRVIWLGLKGDLKNLAQLQKRIEKNLVDLDFKLKLRPFSPHITLGRIKKARTKERQEIGRQLKKLRILPARQSLGRGGNLESRTLVDRVVIYESILSAKGSVYKKLEEFNLI